MSCVFVCCVCCVCVCVEVSEWVVLRHSASQISRRGRARTGNYRNVFILTRLAPDGHLRAPSGAPCKSPVRWSVKKFEHNDGNVRMTKGHLLEDRRGAFAQFVGVCLLQKSRSLNDRNWTVSSLCAGKNEKLQQCQSRIRMLTRRRSL